MHAYSYVNGDPGSSFLITWLRLALNRALNSLEITFHKAKACYGEPGSDAAFTKAHFNDLVSSAYPVGWPSAAQAC